ncbi:hypothetical protein P7266_0072 [Lactococcus cremoris]|nr:hypothetical protein P7266_0072 [Lactococcus cremoris]
MTVKKLLTGLSVTFKFKNYVLQLQFTKGALTTLSVIQKLWN